MKRLHISNSDKVALIDDEDFVRVAIHNWRFDNCRITSVTSLNGQKFNRTLAGLIMRDHKNMYDHKDRDPFNNQKENLRIATKSQNKANTPKYKRSDSDSKYKGVSLNMRERSKTTLWKARIRVNGKLIYLGSFHLEEEAALAYNQAAIKYFGEFACINEIKS
jgi:hypothetical protein